MRHALLISLLCLMALPAQAALPGDSAEGQKLHEANCVSCHNTGIYTRRDRHVRSLDGLYEQLDACTHGAQLSLTADQQKSLVKFLNEQFYKFK